MDFIQRIKNALQCPKCRRSLRYKEGNFTCLSCGSIFPINTQNPCVRFVGASYSEEKKDISNIRDYFKKWPKFYYFIATVFGPLWRSGLGTEEFLQVHGGKGIVLNIGSGPKVIGSTVINLDLFPYRGVSVVADALNLPFKDNSVEAVVCTEILEHLKDPEVAVSEINRVLTKSGSVYVSVPFLFPFHSSPSDFRRWTHGGLRNLFADFETIEIGVYAGPFSALTVWCSYLFASLFSFGSASLYWFLMNLSMFVFFPIKLFDFIASRLPFAINSSAELYVIARKK
ncbi:class I SAM-dependent methyltransferase [Patescibacteria group bacterium]|nr:MAG: class I SAM-dependent methyltransferase [Patescibacteria group bacterium]